MNQEIDREKLAELLTQMLAVVKGESAPESDSACKDERHEPELFETEKDEVVETPEHEEHKDHEPEDHDEDPEDEEIEGEEEEVVEDEDEESDSDDLGIDAEILDMCGMTGEPPEIQRAFAAGVRYGEKKEKQEPKKLDSEHESEGVKREEAEKAAQDAAYQALNDKFSAKFEAMENCRQTLGSVKFAAFDSAEDVYAAAYKRETGKTIDKAVARVAYENFLAGRAVHQNAVDKAAQDAAIDSEMESKVLSEYL